MENCITPNLDPMKTPLNSSCLIEASAGTGKTYTMVSLYLRLLLQVGDNAFPTPLTVDQILVVTFTNDATQELKERIRSKISQVRSYFEEFQNTGRCTEIEKDDFLSALLQEVEKTGLALAITRLRLAEQYMDSSAIFTIHSFCQRMLLQYAFDSGIHFDLKLNNDDELLNQLNYDVWRENFYPLNLTQTHIVDHLLNSPQQLFSQGKSLLFTDLSVTLPYQSISQLLTQIETTQTAIKQYWQQHSVDLLQWFIENCPNLTYSLGKIDKVKEWITEIDQWANSEKFVIPSLLMHDLTPSNIHKRTRKGSTLTVPPALVEIEALLQNYQPIIWKNSLIYLYALEWRQKLFAYRQTHNEKDFNDLLRLLKEALYSHTGHRLAELIHHQFPFAMIDEFQDTDPQQFAIFAKIYLNDTAKEANGFIMIGDPKQSIYRFRGADIFTYLTAAKKVHHRLTLNKNWRSSEQLVQAVNELFADTPNPFIFSDIQFQAVKSKENSAHFYLEQQKQPPLVCYYTDKTITARNRVKTVESALAESCANSIQHWLKLAEQGKALISEQPLEKTENPSSGDILQAKDIAVLVRNGKQAELIKQRLANKGIGSTFLSEKSSVFASQTAKELNLLLQACLYPFDDQRINAVLATRLFALSAAELYQLQHNELMWEQTIQRFVRYQKIWHWQGVLPMLYQLIATENLAIKAKQFVDGERRLVDLLHLADLLQQASNAHYDEIALLHWYQKQLTSQQENQENDELRLRLESELNLVKIVTIHKSKGLEYKLVWLPFIAFNQNFNDKLNLIHNEQGETILDFAEQQKIQQQKELQAEELRILYVALTRAKCQINLGVPLTYPKGLNWNALLYLLTQGAEQQSKTEKEYDYPTLLKQKWSDSQLTIINSNDLPQDNWRAKHQSALLQVRHFQQTIPTNWQVTSFSSLYMMHEKAYQKTLKDNPDAIIYPTEYTSAIEQIADIDYYSSLQHYSTTQDTTQSAAHSIITQDYPEHYSPLDLPTGIQVGTALHRFFEKCDFTQAISDEQLTPLLTQLHIDEQWQASLQQWLNTLFTAPLDTTGLCLAQIKPANKLVELQFYLKINRTLQIDKLNQLLQQHHSLGKQREALQLEDLTGFVRGFIDLVFRHNGRYYLIDYKSNYLGSDDKAYQNENLKQVMCDYQYDLQYLLYTLALHRYLRHKIADYSYQQHFGGVYYLFLRGIHHKQPEQGIYFDKPCVELIEQLDQLWGE